jgi:uncharacterized protein (TIGR03086 family)
MTTKETKEMTMDQIEGLERSYETLSKLVADVTPTSLAAPTPCPDWNTRTLLNHVCGAGRMFTLVNAGQTAGPDAGDLIGDDPTAAVAAVARDNIASWRAPGGLDGERTYPFGTFPAPAALLINLTEVAVHAWDLARATDRPASIDPDLASVLYEFWAAVPLDDARKRGAFGAPIPIAGTAPFAERLLAHLGRS